jgi:hypothetical protein
MPPEAPRWKCNSFGAEGFEPESSGSGAFITIACRLQEAPALVDRQTELSRPTITVAGFPGSAVIPVYGAELSPGVISVHWPLEYRATLPAPGLVTPQLTYSVPSLATTPRTGLLGPPRLVQVWPPSADRQTALPCTPV